MGKNNYSFLQRQGLSMFWQNSFLICKNYNKFFFFSIFSEKLIINILKNFFKYNFINKNYKNNFINLYKQRMFTSKLSKTGEKNLLLQGRIWFFRVNKWIVISVSLFFKNKSINVKKYQKKKKKNLKIF